MSPRSKKQFEQMRKISVDAIKEAALELFAHNGYHSTSISQIAKEANVSKGLVYNYFDSKEDLLHQIVLEATVAGEQVMTAALAAEKPANEQIREMIEGFFGMVQANLHYWKLLTSLAFQTDALKTMEDTLRQKSETNLEFLVQIFDRKGVAQPREEAMYFGAVLDGIAIQFMNFEEDYPFEAMKAFVIEKFCT